MNRDDIQTFLLALVATVITYLLVDIGPMGDNSMFVLSLVVFGVLLVGKSIVQSDH